MVICPYIQSKQKRQDAVGSIHHGNMQNVTKLKSGSELSEVISEQSLNSQMTALCVITPGRLNVLCQASVSFLIEIPCSTM